MRAFWFCLVSTVAATAFVLPVHALADEAKPAVPQKPQPTQEELEKQFEKSLTGVTLVGHYSVNGKPSLKTERYKIVKIAKQKGEIWLFEANMKWGDHDVTLPMPITVKWAGDTPMISITKVSFPGLGTYSARVLFYDGQYAGTWSAGDHGGQLFGELVKETEGKPADESKPAADE